MIRLTNRGGAAAREQRTLNGVLLLDKPAGITSQAAVTRVKRLLKAAKAGHTGTLDPMATGLLPICLGEATKFSQLLLGADKTYVASLKLGVSTTTGDLEGEVTAREPAAVDVSMVESTLPGLVGDILQTPPMYSAVKRAGKPLYKYARAGVELAREARCVRVHAIEFMALSNDELRIRVRCGKGTYIRVLAEDIGRRLGCGACLSALTRTEVGSFGIESAVALEALLGMVAEERDAHLLPVDSMVASLPRIDLNSSQTREITTGRAVQNSFMALPGLVRIYGPREKYLGIAAVEASGILLPRRLMAGGTSI